MYIIYLVKILSNNKLNSWRYVRFFNRFAASPPTVFALDMSSVLIVENEFIDVALLTFYRSLAYTPSLSFWL